MEDVIFVGGLMSSKTEFKVHYIATLVKNREFIVVRFSSGDYGTINKKLIRVYLHPYIKDGWQLLEIECESCRWYKYKTNDGTGGVNFTVKLVKNNEFIILRFCRKDYEELTKKIIRETHIQSYIKDGYNLLDIEQFRSERWWE